jgi:hypothetical protein
VRAKPAFCNDVEGVTGGRGFHGIAVGDVTTGREFHRDAKAGCQVVRTEKELLREERRDRENKRQEDRTEKLNDIRNANKRKIRSRKDCKWKVGVGFRMTQESCRQKPVRTGRGDALKRNEQDGVQQDMHFIRERPWQAKAEWKMKKRRKEMNKKQKKQQQTGLTNNQRRLEHKSRHKKRSACASEEIPERRKKW